MLYKIINIENKQIIGYTQEPYYIKISKNGSYIQATKAEALGIAYKGNPYNLFGTDGLGVEITISIIEIDEELLFNNLNALATSINNIEDALCELDKEALNNESNMG